MAAHTEWEESFVESILEKIKLSMAPGFPLSDAQHEKLEQIRCGR